MKKLIILFLITILLLTAVEGYQWKNESGYNIHIDFASGGVQENQNDYNVSLVIGGSVIPFNDTGIDYDIHQGLLYIIWSNVIIADIDITAPTINCTIIYHGVEWGEVNCTSTEINVNWSMSIINNQTLEPMVVFDTRTSNERKFVGLEENTRYLITINATDLSDNVGTDEVSFRTNYAGEIRDMTLGISLFLLLFNIGLFITPVFVKQFTKNPASNYVVRKIIIMMGILVLWFNSLIFRQLATNFGLDIDNYLIAYWWFFTLAVFIVIFTMCYVMVIGALQLAKQTRIARRMGDGEAKY